MTDDAYGRLEGLCRRQALIEQVGAVLQWDTAAIMPPGGAALRGEQRAEMSLIAHDMLTSPEMAETIAEAASQSGLDPWQRRNVELVDRRYKRASVVPGPLVAAFSRACSTCETAWRSARPASDFAAVLPSLAEVLKLARERGRIVAEALGLDVYDAMLDEFDPGSRGADIDVLFDDLGGWLPGFLDDVLAAQDARAAPETPPGPFPAAIQESLGRRFMQDLGFSFDQGRLDVSLHPFCGGTPGDVRITTRYDEEDFTSALMGVLHETGHALYEQGLPETWRLQPVGGSLGMSIHESQSLLIEMQVCRSRAFLEFAAPLIRDAFSGQGPAWSADNLHAIYTRVSRGFIRVDADEVTYPAHVILRYRLEKAMIDDDLDLAGLPSAWNQGMRDLLGVTPPDDRLGCLQDIHWYDGAWGYFPTYTLGAMAAAQLFQTGLRTDPDILPAIAGGDFAPLLSWLRASVHAKGSSMTGAALMEEVTGAPLGTAAFKAHLKRRYLGGAG